MPVGRASLRRGSGHVEAGTVQIPKLTVALTSVLDIIGGHAAVAWYLRRGKLD